MDQMSRWITSRDAVRTVTDRESGAVLGTISKGIENRWDFSTSYDVPHRARGYETIYDASYALWSGWRKLNGH